MHPSVYSSPVDNLNNHVFTIYKANPLDGCSKLDESQFQTSPSISQHSYLIAIDGDSGYCGVHRRIQWAKDAGAKGLVIVSTDNSQIDPYGEFTDNTFLVFIVLKKQDSQKVLFPEKYVLASITSSSTSSKTKTKQTFQFWISALDTKSYELVSNWQQTLHQIPIIAQNVYWKPRYAIWGCNAGTFSTGSVCLNDSKYQSSCACAGQLCSPQTKYKSTDAPIKEDARQRIIYKSYEDKYLSYMQAFRKNCLKSFQTQLFAEDCANSQMMTLEIDHEKVHSQLQKLMEKCEGPIFNELLHDRKRFSQLGMYPSAVLDQKPVEFSSKRELQVQLCRKLSLQKQQGCVKVLRISTIASFTINVLFFILIIGGLVGIVSLLLLIYRKTIRKQMHKEMKMQVSASVEHYLAMTDTK